MGESAREERHVPLFQGHAFGEVLGGTPVMRALFFELDRAARTEEPILLQGESGSGKELFAREIHQRSQRQSGPFVVVDCAALTPELAESELFGVEVGAYTGAVEARVGLLERAHGGTLFLDEVGELPLQLQARLLRVLEAHEVRALGAAVARPADARVVAATHRNLRQAVAARGFRADLYHRLGVLEFQVPPLRERIDDLELLVERFLEQQRPARGLRDLPAGMLELFRSHRWPGNVRELRNAVARLWVKADVESALLTDSGEETGGATGWKGLPLKDARNALLYAFERQYVSGVLEAHQGNVTAAARAMGVSRQIVHRLMARHQLRGGHGQE
jgi:transcriptional regulator with PAS, ATPase and Fis domain